MDPTDPLQAALLVLALQVSEGAAGDNIPIETKIEALKAAGTYDINRRKLKPKGHDDAEKDNFGAFAKTIANAGVATQ